MLLWRIENCPESVEAASFAVPPMLAAIALTALLNVSVLLVPSLTAMPYRPKMPMLPLCAFTKRSADETTSICFAALKSNTVFTDFMASR